MVSQSTIESPTFNKDYSSVSNFEKMKFWPQMNEELRSCYFITAVWKQIVSKFYML